MKKISCVIIFGALLLNGCSNGGDDTATIPTPKPTPIPEETKTPDTANNNLSIDSIGSLKPPTNAEDRLRQINQGRTNPFNSTNPPALIQIRANQPIPSTPVNTAVVITPIPIMKKPSGSITSPTVTKNNPTTGTTIKNNPSLSNTDKNIVTTVPTIKTNPPVGTTIKNNLASNKGGENTPILAPSPTEALNMLVSGVINLDGKNVALIQAPWKNVPQSVKVGDIISDGNVSVKVKEIRFNNPTSIALLENDQTVYRNINDDKGFVVFEQYGQQVTKEVGNIVKKGDEVAKL